MSEFNEEDLIETILNLMYQHRGKHFPIDRYMKEEMSTVYSAELRDRVIDTLLFEGIIERPSKSSGFYTYNLTDNGMHIMQTGGRRNHLRDLRKAHEIGLQKQEAELAHLVSSTKVNEWLIRSRWVPHFLSLASLLLALLALLKSFGWV
jgi:hypothetical protein